MLRGRDGWSVRRVTAGSVASAATSPAQCASASRPSRFPCGARSRRSRTRALAGPSRSSAQWRNRRPDGTDPGGRCSARACRCARPRESTRRPVGPRARASRSSWPAARQTRRWPPRTPYCRSATGRLGEGTQPSRPTASGPRQNRARPAPPSSSAGWSCRRRSDRTVRLAHAP